MSNPQDEREALHDFTTHRTSWRKAIEHLANADDSGYWTHELKAYDAAMVALDAALANQRAEAVPREGCDYVSSPDTVCNKCWRVHQVAQPDAVPLTDEQVEAAWRLGFRAAIDAERLNADEEWSYKGANVIEAISGMGTAKPAQPYLIVYEWDTPHGTHRSFSPANWNGWQPTRAVELFTEARTSTAPQPEGDQPDAVIFNRYKNGVTTTYANLTKQGEKLSNGTRLFAHDRAVHLHLPEGEQRSLRRVFSEVKEDGLHLCVLIEDNTDKAIYEGMAANYFKDLNKPVVDDAALDRAMEAQFQAFMAGKTLKEAVRMMLQAAQQP